MRPEYENRIQELEKKVENLTHLLDISASLNSRMQLNPLLKHIMDVAVDITDSEAASVLLWNQRTQQLFFAASTSESADKLIGMPVPMDSIAGSVFRTKRIVQVDNARNDPRHYDRVDEDVDFVTRSLLTVPMTYKDNIIGVVQALNKKELPWTQDDRSHLQILASQAAVAIEGAQLVMELKRVNEDLLEADKLKNDFIAIASHELRTPLGVIMGYASFLQEETTEEAQDHASKVMDSALKLRQIIEDMVNLRYLKTNQMDMERQEMRVSELFETIERDTLTLIDATQHTLEIQPSEKDVHVNVDPTRLGMAITNLVNNALSFTEKGGTITLKADIHDDREVWISVVDEGLGIEKEQLDKIFKEFYQVEDHMIRHHEGLGIGLSITRAIVDAHGGRIWAESEGLGKGATFIFSLPVMK